MSNPLSAIGRMSYGAHLALYPVFGGSGWFFWTPYSASSNAKAAAEAEAAMPKAKAVDPDNFNPFTPIPFHNNHEIRYRMASLKMINYQDKTHTNVRDYPFKSFHDSYDHSNKKAYTYNWVSTVPSHHA